MDHLKSTIMNLTKTITKTSGNLISSTKLTLSLSNEEMNLKSLYEEIGRKVHEIYAYGGTLGKFFDEKYVEIQQLEEKIASLKEQIDSKKGTRECIHCRKQMTRDAEFCPHCGQKQADAPVSPSTSTASEIPTTLPKADSDKAVLDPVVNTTSFKPLPSDGFSTAATAAPTTATPTIPATTEITCPICGHVQDAGERFCIECGRMIN